MSELKRARRKSRRQQNIDAGRPICKSCDGSGHGIGGACIECDGQGYMLDPPLPKPEGGATDDVMWIETCAAVCASHDDGEHQVCCASLEATIRSLPDAPAK